MIKGRLILSVMMSLSLGFQPLVQAKAALNLKSQVLDYIKKTGLNQKSLTAGEWFAKAKAFMPPEFAAAVAPHVAKDPNSIMPKLEIRDIKDSKNPETDAVRLIFNLDNKLHTMDVLAKDEDLHLRFEGKTMSASHLFFEGTLKSKLTNFPLFSGYQLNQLRKTNPKLFFCL